MFGRVVPQEEPVRRLLAIPKDRERVAATKEAKPKGLDRRKRIALPTAHASGATTTVGALLRPGPRPRGGDGEPILRAPVPSLELVALLAPETAIPNARRLPCATRPPPATNVDGVVLGRAWTEAHRLVAIRQAAAALRRPLKVEPTGATFPLAVTKPALQRGSSIGVAVPGLAVLRGTLFPPAIVDPQGPTFTGTYALAEIATVAEVMAHAPIPEAESSRAPKLVKPLATGLRARQQQWPSQLAAANVAPAITAAVAFPVPVAISWLVEVLAGQAVEPLGLASTRLSLAAAHAASPVASPGVP